MRLPVHILPPWLVLSLGGDTASLPGHSAELWPPCRQTWGKNKEKKYKPCYDVNLPKDNSQLGQVVPAVTPRCWKDLLSCLPQRVIKISFPMLTSTLGTPGFLKNPTRRGFSWLIPHGICLGQTYKRWSTLGFSEQAQHPFPRNMHTHTHPSKKPEMKQRISLICTLCVIPHKCMKAIMHPFHQCSQLVSCVPSWPKCWQTEVVWNRAGTNVQYTAELMLLPALYSSPGHMQSHLSLSLSLSLPLWVPSFFTSKNISLFSLLLTVLFKQLVCVCVCVCAGGGKPVTHWSEKSGFQL